MRYSLCHDMRYSRGMIFPVMKEGKHALENNKCHGTKNRVYRKSARRRRKFSELCTEYSVSRPTGYRWVKRYVEAGSFAQLQERSRRPHNSPARTPSTQEAEVIELRKCYGWGGKKLHELLKREGIELSVRTINRIIN